MARSLRLAPCEQARRFRYFERADAGVGSSRSDSRPRCHMSLGPSTGPGFQGVQCLSARLRALNQAISRSIGRRKTGWTLAVTVWHLSTKTSRPSERRATECRHRAPPVQTKPAAEMNVMLRIERARVYRRRQPQLVQCSGQAEQSDSQSGLFAGVRFFVTLRSRNGRRGSVTPNMIVRCPGLEPPASHA